MESMRTLFECGDAKLEELTAVISDYYDSQKTAARDATSALCANLDKTLRDQEARVEKVADAMEQFEALEASGEIVLKAVALRDLDRLVAAQAERLETLYGLVFSQTQRLKALGVAEVAALEVEAMAAEFARRKADLQTAWAGTVATEFGKVDKLIRSTLDEAVATLPAPTKCVVCRQADATYMITPCNHAMYCEPCVQQIGERCAVCNGPKRGKMRVYL